jgi:hypothetical protein
MKKETVVMILDSEYGDRVVDLAMDHAVWIIGSDVNRVAVKRIHATGGKIASSVTIWSSPDVPSTQEQWESKIGDIERHHGEFSQSPPVSIIEVVGLSVSEAARAAFREFDYFEIETTSFGFRAYKKQAA